MYYGLHKKGVIWELSSLGVSCRDTLRLKRGFKCKGLEGILRRKRGRKAVRDKEGDMQAL